MTTATTRKTLADALAENPTAALEDIARSAGVTPLAVLKALPEGEVTALSGALMVATLDGVAEWEGDVTFIVNTGPVILEAKGKFHGGTVANGMYNLRGKPISGHLHIAPCAHVAFVRRKLFGMDTRSIQFYGGSGDCLFKVYLGRNEQRQLLANQIAAFDALEQRLLAA